MSEASGFVLDLIVNHANDGHAWLQAAPIGGALVALVGEQQAGEATEAHRTLRTCAAAAGA